MLLGALRRCSLTHAVQELYFSQATLSKIWNCSQSRLKHASLWKKWPVGIKLHNFPPQKKNIYQNTLENTHTARAVTAPGEGFSQRILARENNDARQTLQILVGARNPVILLIAPPGLWTENTQVTSKWNLLSHHLLFYFVCFQFLTLLCTQGCSWLSRAWWTRLSSSGFSVLGEASSNTALSWATVSAFKQEKREHPTATVRRKQSWKTQGPSLGKARSQPSLFQTRKISHSCFRISRYLSYSIRPAGRRFFFFLFNNGQNQFGRKFRPSWGTESV